MRINSRPARVLAVMLLAASPGLALAQTNGTNATGTNAAATTTAPAATTMPGTVNSRGGSGGWWGLIGLIGLAGLAGGRRRATVATTRP